MFENSIGLILFSFLFVLVRFYTKKPLFFLWGPLSFIFCVFLISFSDLDYFIPSVTSLSVYLLATLLVVEYFLILKLSKTRFYYWIFLFPVFVLVILKGGEIIQLLGMSYLVFRMILLGHEIIQKRIEVPNFFTYLTYCCFPFTYQMGPINPYENFITTWNNPRRLNFDDKIFQKLFFGLFKFYILSNMVNLIINSNFSGIKESHSLLFLFLYSVLTYLSVYLNFSGFSDIVISICKITGIKLKENFDNPLLAKNIQDFWMKWHLSLTDLVREIVFLPMALQLKRRFPRAKVWPLIILFLVFFIIIGLWHGVKMEFFCLGVYHALGMIFYQLFKNYSPPVVERMFRTNIGVLFSWFLTSSFVSFSFIFFNLSLESISRILF